MSPPIETVRENSDDLSEPPRMLSVSIDVVPGNDLDAINSAVDALDQAYEELREALLHQRSGVGAEAVREFWKGNRGQAFRATCALLVVVPPEDG